MFPRTQEDLGSDVFGGLTIGYPEIYISIHALHVRVIELREGLRISGPRLTD
jgi:hypothetical protein